MFYTISLAFLKQKKMHYGFKNVLKCIIYFLDYLETYLDAWVIYKKTLHTNTTNNFMSLTVMKKKHLLCMEWLFKMKMHLVPSCGLGLT
jgi:hypothetical protein